MKRSSWFVLLTVYGIAFADFATAEMPTPPPTPTATPLPTPTPIVPPLPGACTFQQGTTLTSVGGTLNATGDVEKVCVGSTHGMICCADKTNINQWTKTEMIPATNNTIWGISFAPYGQTTAGWAAVEYTMADNKEPAYQWAFGSWSSAGNNRPLAFFDVWTGNGKVWFVGKGTQSGDAYVVSYDGTNWVDEYRDIGGQMTSVTGFYTGNTPTLYASSGYFGGGGIYKRTNGAVPLWQRVVLPAEVQGAGWRSVSAYNASYVLGVGTNDANELPQVVQYDGTDWSQVTVPVAYKDWEFRRGWVSPYGQDTAAIIFAHKVDPVSHFKMISYDLDSKTFQTLNLPAQFENCFMTNVWGSWLNEFYVVGRCGPGGPTILKCGLDSVPICTKVN